MRESEAMRMFCGFPVGVATLPMFDDVASARRYGFGSRFTESHTRRTSGVSAMHTTSLIKSAESTADAIEMAERSASGVFARRVSQKAASAKARETSSAAASSIMPKRSASVVPSTAACASASVSTRNATTRTAPMIDAAKRSERKPGTRPSDSAT